MDPVLLPHWQDNSLGKQHVKYPENPHPGYPSEWAVHPAFESAQRLLPIRTRGRGTWSGRRFWSCWPWLPLELLPLWPSMVTAVIATGTAAMAGTINAAEIGITKGDVITAAGIMAADIIGTTGATAMTGSSVCRSVWDCSPCWMSRTTWSEARIFGIFTACLERMGLAPGQCRWDRQFGYWYNRPADVEVWWWGGY